MTPRDPVMGVIHPAPGVPRPSERIGVTIGRADSPPATPGLPAVLASPDTTGRSSFATTLHEVAAGNPGAATAYVQGYQHTVAEAMRVAAESWDATVLASGLRGPALWATYKNACGGDASRFVAHVRWLAAKGGAR